jgi:hypothetical protein
VSANILKAVGLAVVVALTLVCGEDTYSQQPPPAQQGGDPPPVPKGVEVMARGPVHEAFASPTAAPEAAPLLAKKPPAAIDEMPPDEKPQGKAIWIGGYWSWDDDRGDYLWVSGCWRTRPPGKEWVPGYWREIGDRWQWVAGFWANSQPAAEGKTEQASQSVTYNPQPPAAPQVAAPPPPPSADAFYVPGHWVWVNDRYVWQAGYYSTIRPGYIWVPAHFRWTPFGYVYVAGYWDLAVADRGMLYAPVVVDVGYVGPAFVYTPAYAVCDALLLSALFIRPCYCHYYFGDYYGPRYVGFGFTSCVVYSSRHYDSLIVYERWQNRGNPGWFNAQVNLTLARNEGRAPLPPRTLVQQTTIINNTTINNTTINKNMVIAPARTVAAARGQKTVPVSLAARTQAKQAAQAIHQAAVTQRQKTESAAAGNPTRPRTTSLNVPAHPSGPSSSARTGPAQQSHTGPGQSPHTGPGTNPGQHPQVGPAPGTRPGPPPTHPTPKTPPKKTPPPKHEHH